MESCNLSSKCVVHRQRAALQLKTQRQLAEAFETRLQRIQTNMQANVQANVQAVTSAPSYTASSTDTNLPSSK